MTQLARFEGATVAGIEEHRWDVRIALRMPDGTVEKLIASADSWWTDSSGIWFGTEAEYEEASP